jgi:hypothetical protein
MMNLPRPKRFLLGGLAAIGGLVLLGGCDSPGSTVQPQERSASEEGRNAPPPPASPKPSEASSAGTRNPVADVEAATREPVAAPRPDGDAPDIALTSADALTSAERADAASTPETAPPLDPSQFPGGIIPANPNAQPLPGGPRLLVPERTFRAEGRPRALRVNYDDLDLLRVLNMGDPLPADVVDHFPQWLKDLDGKTVRLRGFMYPAFEEELTRFILTRDTGACCFGPNPKIYYLVNVKLKEGTKVRYVENRPFDVVGTFHIDPRYVDGTLMRLYRISDAVVPE